MLDWVKKNKTLLIVVAGLFLFYFLYKTFFGVNLNGLSVSTNNSSAKYGGISAVAPSYDSFGSAAGIAMPSIGSSREYTPQTNTQNRMVVQESNLSLLVKDVTDVRNKTISYAQGKGGYMINSSTSNPQDAPTATVTIRIPSKNLEESLSYFHSLGVKVVSENLLGTDVTDQFVDIDTRISQVQKTIDRLQKILDEAREINDITSLTNQIINYQNQIDSLKGQQMSLAKNAELAKLTIYLSTDEIALPYAPSETFRPNVIFKLAVRSLVTTLRGLAEKLIWIAVYSVIWIPLAIAYYFIKKWWNNRNTKPSADK